MRRPIVTLLLVLAVFGASCGSTNFEISFGGTTGSIESVAADLIENELAARLGVALEPDCPEVTDPGVGSTFTCTGTTPDGEVIIFDGVVDREDHIDVVSRNVILADQLGGWEDVAGDAISEEVGGPITVDCGDGYRIFPDEPYELVCEGSDDFGDTERVSLIITDLENGSFRWRIG